MTLEKAGQRKGHTIMNSPGDTVIKAGEKNVESQTTIYVEAVNGDIVLNARNGKIRMNAKDIELTASGETGNKGNVTVTATENIKLESKKFLVNASNFLRLSSPGTVELAANSGMIIYASLIRGVTDAVAIKDSKVGGQRIQTANSFL
jgi:uncharacterized protein (DUF2345 family)